jgi:ethanolamine utilization protein EutA
MDVDIIKSVGIDIGTTTTQLVVSELTVKNVAPGSLVPRMEITDKVVKHRSGIHFTPIKDDNLVDSEAVFSLVSAEFAKAGISQDDIDTGAVIVTGETAKKENARRILDQISIFSGDFVVATAGGKLESVIAGKGSGAASFSRNNYCTVANVDIGGGTANIGIFKNGKAIDSCCINVGGRLMQINRNSGVATKISQPMKAVLRDLELTIDPNDKVSISKLENICGRMAEVVVEHLTTQKLSTLSGCLLMTKPLRLDYAIDAVMISGGVADTVYGDFSYSSVPDVAIYGDIGPLLGVHIKKSLMPQKFELIKPTETIRATVIGAGSQTVDVSGSTILVNDKVLPIKNIPAVLPFCSDFVVSEESISNEIIKSIESLYEDGKLDYVAVAFKGQLNLSFKDITVLARGIHKGFSNLRAANYPIIVVLESDIGKVLGQSLRVLDGNSTIVCIDQIIVEEGDYIDIGSTVAGGTVVPVVIKTLVFETEQL